MPGATSAPVRVPRQQLPGTLSGVRGPPAVRGPPGAAAPAPPGVTPLRAGGVCEGGRHTPASAVCEQDVRCGLCDEEAQAITIVQGET